MGLRLAIFGQGRFGREVTERLTEAGHAVVGVWAPPDNGRAEPLAALAVERGWPLFHHAHYRRRGRAIPAFVEEYRRFAPDLNVLPYMMAILPSEIAAHPAHGSVCFHPSLLPAFRGGAALNWQILEGARESGVSVFKITERIDEGPLLLQRGGVRIDPTDTMGSLYFDKLYPIGVEAMVEAVTAVAAGTARYTPQPSGAASAYGLVDDEVARIDWRRPAEEIERLIRGCDPVPGALTSAGGRPLRCYGGGFGATTTRAAPGTVLGPAGEALEIATGRGAVRVARVAFAGEGKQPAARAGLADGTRLGP